jgi:hypothetical protein
VQHPGGLAPLAGPPPGAAVVAAMELLKSLLYTADVEGGRRGAQPAALHPPAPPCLPCFCPGLGEARPAGP